MLLHTLGSPALDGVPLVGISTPRKALVLLAFLARRAPRTVDRAELATLLWEDRDDPRARQSLRQVLLELKRVLGDALRLTDTGVAIDPAALPSDVVRFEQAIAADQLEDAVACWSGDFLAGTEDVGGEGYRAWLEVEREGLRRQLAVALSRLMAGAERRGDTAGALQWAERLAGLRPFDETATERVITLLDRSGRTVEALARYASFAARLRVEHDARPSAALVQLAQRIEARGAEGAARRGPGSPALFTPDLVGRDAALAALAGAWQEARDGGVAGVVVEGEAGIGKTRLVEEFLRDLGRRERFVLLTARGPTPPDRAFGTFHELLRGLVDAPALPATPRAALAELASHAPALTARFAELPAPMGDPESAGEALAAALDAVAEESPVVLWVDDIAQADESSLAAILVATRRTPRALLYLLAARSDQASLPALAELHGRRAVRRLVLRPLESADVERLLASMLALAPADRVEIAGRMHDAGGGNPLHAIELTAALIDEGALEAAGDGTWRLTSTARGRLPLPPTVRDAIARRLAGLAAPTRAIAAAAARQGRAFDPEAAIRGSGMAPSEAKAALEDLFAHRLIRPAPDAPDCFEFAHELVWRVVYEQASPAAPRRKVRPWAVPAGAAAAALAIAAAILGRPAAPPTTPSSRVVVASFENQTRDPALDAAGQFIADWITQGIAQSEVAPVVDVRSALTSARNIAADSSKRGTQRLRALADETGADRVVWGTYYLRGDSLAIQAAVSDARTGEILRSLDPVVVASRDPAAAVEGVRHAVLGALALLYNTRGSVYIQRATRPPTYPAYQAFMEGIDFLTLYKSEESIAKFAHAYRLDTTFVLALIWESDGYAQIGQFAAADSVLRLAALSRDRLGSFDRRFLDFKRTELAGDFAKALDAARDLARMAPGSEALFLQGSMALHLNRPGEALRALASVDPEKGFLKGWPGYWGYPLQAYYMIGELDSALAVAREGRRRYPTSRDNLLQEIMVLSAMGRTAEVDRLLDESDGLPEDPGLPLPRLMRGAATTLRGHGFVAESKKMATRAIERLDLNDSTPNGDYTRLTLVEALYLADRFDQARAIADRMLGRNPSDMTWQGYAGLLAARTGDRARAEAILRQLGADRRPYSYGRGTLWRARIEAASGNDQAALALLRSGLAQGLAVDQAFVNLIPDFDRLRALPEYQEMFRPKG
jgi:DNA-binding SARP family transcriptional activator/tetratricopeptide (TPR) repeat protein/TolB-like protein